MISSKHRTIEIYFVLYLAAIIFLLPDKSPESNLKHSVVSDNSSFSIQPLNNLLSCRYYVDSSGVHIIEHDSINTIICKGKVKEVNFSFEVEDINAKQKITISGKSGFFKFEETLNNREVKFFWNPELTRNTNKSFNVRVIATAKGGVSRDDNISEVFKAETQFSMILIDVTEEVAGYGFDDEKYLQDNPLSSGLNTDLNNPSNRVLTSSTGEIILDIDIPEVKSIAYKNWSNKIYVFGANPQMDLSGKPTLKVFLEPSDNNGTAEISEVARNYIVVSGKTPSHGRMKVATEMKFSFDNKKRSIDFYVAPLPIGRPQFESVMYPEKKYSIKTNLPMLSGQATQAFLRDKKEIILKSEQGEVINFKPDVSLIGKVLTLERLIDNVVYDKYDIRIHDYPEPVIFNIQKDKELEIKIQTRSFGYFNGERNLVKLEINGNATDRELRGQITEEDITYLQVFRLTPKDKDKPFKFEVKAIDSRGRVSVIKKYGWNE